MLPTNHSSGRLGLPLRSSPSRALNSSFKNYYPNHEFLDLENVQYLSGAPRYVWLVKNAKTIGLQTSSKGDLKNYRIDRIFFGNQRLRTKEEQKGNTARAVFCFHTMYPNPAGKIENIVRACYSKTPPAEQNISLSMILSGRAAQFGAGAMKIIGLGFNLGHLSSNSFDHRLDSGSKASSARNDGVGRSAL